MRIAIFLSEEYVFTFDMLKALLSVLREEGHAVAGVVFFPDRLTKFKGSQISLAYLRIFGPAVFASLALRSIGKRIFAGGSFGDVCSHYGAEELRAADPNEERLVRWVKDKEVDVILNFVGYLMREEMIKAPKICALNKHAGLLPAYKGVFPVFWAIMNGDPVGLTIHKMDKAMDEGEIVTQKAYPSHGPGTGRRSVYDYYGLIFSETPALVAESLRFLASGERKTCGHNMPPSYFGLPSRKDYLKFKRLGHRFV